MPVLIHAADPKSFWDDFDGDNERWLELKTHPRRKRSDTDPASWEKIIGEQHEMFKNLFCFQGNAITFKKNHKLRLKLFLTGLSPLTQIILNMYYKIK